MNFYFFISLVLVHIYLIILRNFFEHGYSISFVFVNSMRILFYFPLKKIEPPLVKENKNKHYMLRSATEIVIIRINGDTEKKNYFRKLNLFFKTLQSGIFFNSLNQKN